MVLKMWPFATVGDRSVLGEAFSNEDEI